MKGKQIKQFGIQLRLSAHFRELCHTSQNQIQSSLPLILIRELVRFMRTTQYECTAHLMYLLEPPTLLKSSLIFTVFQQLQDHLHGQQLNYS